MRNYSALLLFVLSNLLFESGWASTSVLPQGRFYGAVYYLNFSNISKQFDNQGNKVLIADQFGTPLNAPMIASFKSRAQELIKELNNLGTNGEDLKYGDIISAGTLELDIEANVDVTAFIFGYGLTNWLTLLAILPYQSATVKVEGKMTGTNNASHIKQQLGGIAPKEMQDGLDELSKLNFDTFLTVIKDRGYEDPTFWSGSGIRDTYIALRGQYPLDEYMKFGGMLWFKFPTGEIESPHSLSSLPFGEGNYGFQLQPAMDINWLPYFQFALSGNWKLELPTTIEKRIPLNKDDILPNKKQLGSVERSLGDSIGGSFETKFFPDATPAFALSLIYRYLRKFPDKYDAPYLASNLTETTHSIAGQLEFDGISLYLTERFKYTPFILDILYEVPWAGRNSYNLANLNIFLQFAY